MKFERLSDWEIRVTNRTTIYAFSDKDIIILSKQPIKSAQIQFRKEAKSTL